MWRAFFLGVGFYCCLLGLECLVIDKAIMRTKGQNASGAFESATRNLGKPREVVPADWAPWSFLSGGVVTILYSFTLPKRSEQKK